MSLFCHFLLQFLSVYLRKRIFAFNGLFCSWSAAFIGSILYQRLCFLASGISFFLLLPSLFNKFDRVRESIRTILAFDIDMIQFLSILLQIFEFFRLLHLALSILLLSDLLVSNFQHCRQDLFSCLNNRNTLVSSSILLDVSGSCLSLTKNGSPGTTYRWFSFQKEAFWIFVELLRFPKWFLFPCFLHGLYPQQSGLSQFLLTVRLRMFGHYHILQLALWNLELIFNLMSQSFSHFFLLIFDCFQFFLSPKHL